MGDREGLKINMEYLLKEVEKGIDEAGCRRGVKRSRSKFVATGVFLFACFLNFLFHIGVYPINDIVIVSAKGLNHTCIHSPKLSLPPKLPRNTE